MAFENSATKDGLTCKLWRGERMCLLGFDVDTPEADFVGFAVECKAPGGDFVPLSNRIAFDYKAGERATGARRFSTLDAPLQKYRWVHFPFDPKAGGYEYRITKMHMPQDGQLVKGATVTLDIDLDPVTYADLLDVGFTRNFASSQAYADRFQNAPDILPKEAALGLEFPKAEKEAAHAGVYDWLGFEAKQLLFGLIQEVVDNSSRTLDMLAYDFNEPDLLAMLIKLGSRLRIVIDDSKDHVDGSAEQAAAGKLEAAGAEVKRTHFNHLQHHKVLIAKRNGLPYKASCGSTNFSFRGLYIQANNVIVFAHADVAQLMEQVFEAAFHHPHQFNANSLAQDWHPIETAPGLPRLQFCFSPHAHPELSLGPVGAAIDQATSSVFFAIAFLNQIESGPVRTAINGLMSRPLFSYGIANITGDSLTVKKPDGSTGLVDFEYLAKNAPEPFKSEWQGGKGINIHHKFVVTDFSLNTAKVFTGSCNMAPSGEKGNGDHLILIEDREVATAYAIEAVRMFDHLHFRTVMKDSETKGGVIKLAKPTAISGAAGAWFDRFYKAGSQLERDRILFSR